MMLGTVIACVVFGAMAALAFVRIAFQPSHYEWPGDERGEPFRGDDV